MTKSCELVYLAYNSTTNTHGRSLEIHFYSIKSNKKRKLNLIKIVAMPICNPFDSFYGGVFYRASAYRRKGVIYLRHFAEELDTRQQWCHLSKLTLIKILSC